MPSYYFHLAFELNRHSLDSSDTLTSQSTHDCYQPPQNLSLFDATLPTHHTSTWASYIAPKKEYLRPRTTDRFFGRPNDSSVPKRDWRAEHRLAAHGEALTVRESGRRSPDTQSSKSRSVSRPKGHSSEDWRFGKISIESVDMESQAMTADHGTAHDNGSTALTLARGHTLAGKYVPSNPRTTEFGWGVVHLYRDSQASPDLGDGNNYSSAARDGGTADINEDMAFVDKECTTLCILAVPAYMTPSDLLGWLGEDTREVVSHFRLIRTGRSNKYMVLMKFRNAMTTKDWQKEWNGKLFNSLEPENCHVVFVKSIRFQGPEAQTDPSNFPDMSNDPFTPNTKQIAANANEGNTLPSIEAPRANAALSTKPAPPPTPALVELPTCPVCLERMDDTTGLTTIFCQHVFHCACLQKWRGSGCPVCRYTQNDPSNGAKIGTEKSECRVCGSTANPWICLICGYAGCGRYEGAHAFAHYEQTGHSFAMDIETQHVWDYDGDAYVHRLIQNKTDGKLVELPSALSLTRDTASELINDDKLEKMSFEYTHLLTSQLDSQRLYFEQQVDRAVDKASLATLAAERAEAAATVATQHLHILQTSHDTLVKTTLPAYERDKERAEKRAINAEQLARKMEKEWRDEKAMSESLMKRIKHLEQKLDEQKLEIQKGCSEEDKRELEEQIRDLMFNISGMQQLKDADEEVREGLVGIVGRDVQEEGDSGDFNGITATADADTAVKKKKRKGAKKK